MARTRRTIAVLLFALAVLLSMAPAVLADALQAPLTSTRGVSISPTHGPAGSVIQVHAWGMGRFATASVSIAPQGGSPVHTHTVAANEAGQLWTTVTIPHTAGAGSLWVVIAQVGTEQAVSPAFRVDGAAPPTTSPCGPTYTVRRGDWLSQIARICHVSLADLLRVNPQIVNPNILFAGQVLNIPAVGTPPPHPSPCGPTYVVRRGDWLSLIARTCQVSVADLLRVNPQIVNPNLLFAGQVLNIPVAGVPIPPPSSEVSATTRFNVNFRPLPTTGTIVIRVIPAGTRVPVLARGPAGWIYVRFEGREGWIAGWLTNIHGDLGGLPFRPS
jgi:LysM repeat protein